MNAAPGVWVTRPAPGNEVTARYLHEAGFSVVVVPVLATRTIVPDPMPATRWPHRIVFVSGTAVRGLEAALENPGLPTGDRSSVKVAAVGRKTARAAEASGWRVETLPEEEHAEGLLAALAGQDLAGETIWIPAGNRAGSATQVLPATLLERGADVLVLPVYETLDRRLGEEDAAALEAVAPGAVVYHSPSSAECVYACASPPARRWREEGAAISIGPVTTRRLRELGAERITECREPSDPGVAEALAAAWNRTTTKD